jgi:hypothetical protein
MNINLTTVARIVPLTALMLGACVSQSAYDQVQAQNQQLQAQLAQSRAEQKFVEAGDMLFPEGGFQLSQAGQAELGNNIAPKLRGLQNAKVVVYGYTDNTPVGACIAATRRPRQSGPVDAARFDSRNFPGVAGSQPHYHFSQGFWRDSPRSLE